MTSTSDSCKHTLTLRGNARSWKRWLKWGYSCLQAHIKPEMADCTILTYHRILPRNQLTDVYSSPHIIVTQETFQKHMKLLSKQAHPLSLADYVSARLANKVIPNKSVIITFDDGWMDNYQFAFPILQKYQIPATIFLTTDYIDTQHTFWPEKLHFLLKNLPKQANFDPKNLLKAVEIPPGHWQKAKQCQNWFPIIEKLKFTEKKQRNQFIAALEEQIGDKTFPKEKHAFLTWPQAEEMQKCGINFGSHGSSHSIFTNLTKKQVTEECQASRDIIHRKLGGLPSFLAYPNGNFTPEIQQILKNVGYQAALTTFSGKNSQKTDIFAQKRINMSESRFLDPFFRFSPSLFKQILS